MVAQCSDAELIEAMSRINPQPVIYRGPRECVRCGGLTDVGFELVDDGPGGCLACRHDDVQRLADAIAAAPTLYRRPGTPARHDTPVRQPDIVVGGQGRTAAEVQSDGLVWIAVVMLAALIVLGAVIGH